MSLQSIKDSFTKRDRVIRILSKDGYFRGVAVKNTAMALDAQARHNLDATPAFFLAKTLAASTLLSAFLKGEERVSIEIDGSNYIRKIYSESIQVGETRGFIRVDNKYDSSKLHSIDDAIGKGKIKVSRILYNKTEPIIGITELAQGDISTDLAYYFSQSEQIPSAVLLDASIDDNGKILQSGGLIIQAMPQAPLKEIVRITERLYELPPISKLLADGHTIEEIIRQATDFDFQIIKHSPVDFYCRCSKEGFLSHLVALGADEIRNMQKEGHTELVCQYCSEKYIIEENDFARILTEIQAKNN
ncbi:MAG TPA: Hsp33 family molecular chaperone HslO [Candidatus Kapabacteria bacterium]|nr:Hsp33 family molecular chaperone HslO [Candidatus Kapabacteria bacterium]